MTSDELVERVLTYLADRIEGPPTTEMRASVAGIPPDAALDIPAALLSGVLQSRTEAAIQLRALLEAREMSAAFGFREER